MSDDAIDPMRELLEEYALGLLGGEQRAAFEARLDADPVLRQELAATTEALATLAFSTPTLPAPALKDRVMAQVAANPCPARREGAALHGATSPVPGAALAGCGARRVTVARRETFARSPRRTARVSSGARCNRGA